MSKKFDTFVEQTQEDFDAFRKQQNERYAEFMRNNWERLVSGVLRPEVKGRPLAGGG